MKEAGQPAIYIRKIKVMVMRARWCYCSCIDFKQGGDYIVHPLRYVNKQRAPTTTPAVRLCLLLRHPLLHVNGVRFFVRS